MGFVYGAVDLLASQYGWSRDDILYNVYPDDLFYLTEEITRRKVSEYMMQLRIAHNPFVKKPKELIDELRNMLPKKKSDTLDVEGFERFKSLLAKNPKFVVKS
ncbi:MAG: hypothetical protein MOGMAGMI_01789 [Candidatus Omnitrophica bacterium]|nr:hypothetical protein [Candidatus Omnitrophota bacterium]